MIERFDKWMRVVLVQRWMLVALLLLGIAAWLFLPTLKLLFGFLYFEGDFSWAFLFDEKDTLHLAYAVAMIVLYGFYRGAYFHPLLNRSYGASLARTPWQISTALPLGPVHLVWQDAVVALILVVVAALPPTGMRYIHLVPTALLVTHGFIQCFCHGHIGARWSTYVTSFLAGAVVLVIDRPIVSLAIAIIIFLLGRQAIRLTLQEFPYEISQRRELRLLPDAVPARFDVPWLAAPMRPLKWYYRIGPVDALLVGTTIAWLVFCFSTRTANEFDMVEAQWVGHFYLAAASVIGRFFLYFARHAPPISIAGRIATRRLIIPRYDMVLIAPLCAAVIAYAMPTLLVLRFGVAPMLAVPLATATTIALAFGLPPRWEDWHLSSRSRESLGTLNSSRFVKTS